MIFSTPDMALPALYQSVDAPQVAVFIGLQQPARSKKKTQNVGLIAVSYRLNKSLRYRLTGNICDTLSNYCDWSKGSCHDSFRQPQRR